MSNSTSISTASNASFNPFQQNVTFLSADGITVVSTTIASIDSWRSSLVTGCITSSIQIGAAFVMFLIMLLITPAKRRGTAIFWVNLASLLVSALSNVLIIAWYPSEYTEFYTWFSGDNSFIPYSVITTGVAGNTMGPIYIFLIETSLFLQTKVICDMTMRDVYRWSIMIISFVLASAAIGFNTAQMVMNNITVFDTSYYNSSGWKWSDLGVSISYTASLWWFCSIFTIKLGIAMWNRKQLGLNQYGPMRIVCIMGGCTMLIPSIFSILEFYSVHLKWEPGSIGHTLVAIMLPLSSMWAAASLDGHTTQSDSDPQSRRNQFFGSGSSLNSNKALLGTSGSGSRKGSFAAPIGQLGSKIKGIFSGRGSSNAECSGGVIGDLENIDLEQFRRAGSGQVDVERTYSVRSSRGLGGIGRD